MRVLLVCVLLCGCAAPLPSTVESKSGDERPLSYPGLWEAGALRAAEQLGCKRATWQLPGESFIEAAAVYAHDYAPGDCLILRPHRGGSEYFLGYAGQFDGCLCAADPKDWTGTPVYYLRDTWEPLYVPAKQAPLT